MFGVLTRLIKRGLTILMLNIENEQVYYAFNSFHSQIWEILSSLAQKNHTHNTDYIDKKQSGVHESKMSKLLTGRITFLQETLDNVRIKIPVLQLQD